MRRILIGEISSYKAIVVANYLKNHYDDLHIIGFDFRNKIKYVHTKYIDEYVHVPNPKTRLNEHLNFLKDVIKKYSIDVFIPVQNDMYGKYIQTKYELNNTFNYVSDFDTYSMLNDKIKLNVLAEKLNISQPRNYQNYETAEIPFVLKPPNLSSSKGVRYILSEDDRVKYKSLSNDTVILQQYINGIGIGFSVFCIDGKILAGYGHERLAEWPIKGGSSVYRQKINNRQIVEITEKIIRWCKFSGFAMFEFKIDKNGIVFLIEVNPRIWGSINQGLQNGVNYFEGILGKSGKINKDSHLQRTTYLSPLIYISLLSYTFRFNFKPLCTFLKKNTSNKSDVSIFDDPLGYISLLVRKI